MTDLTVMLPVGASKRPCSAGLTAMAEWRAWHSRGWTWTMMWSLVSDLVSVTVFTQEMCSRMMNTVR